MWQDRVRIAIAAPPADGKANATLERFLADACGLPQRDVQLVGGLSHRDKTVQLRAARAAVLAGLAQARDVA